MVSKILTILVTVLSNLFWINYIDYQPSKLIFAFRLMSLKIGNNIKVFLKMQNPSPFLW